MPKRPSRSDRSAAWMSALAHGALARAEGRRHLDVADAALAQIARLHAQVGDLRPCRSGSRARAAPRGFPARADPSTRSTLCLNSSDERRRERAVGVHELQDLPETPRCRSASTGDTLQNRPMSRFLSCSRRTTCTLRNSSMWSIFAASARRPRPDEEVGWHAAAAVLGAQPRQRFVVAHLALRQRHDRLQIEIDAVGRRSRCGRSRSCWRARRPTCCGGRGRAALLPGTAAPPDRSGSSPARRRRLCRLANLQLVHGDGFGELPDQRAELAEFRGDRLGAARAPWPRRRRRSCRPASRARRCGGRSPPPGGRGRRCRATGRRSVR